MFTLRQLQKCWEVKKLLQPDFSGIVKNICYGISGKRTRSEAEEELMGHLEDTYERNIAIGKSEKEAFDASVASLGNTRLLSQQLEAVHAHSPAAQMKSALWLFIFGFIVQKFYLNFFSGMQIITSFVGTVLILLSLFLMRKVNKNLRFAFLFCALSFFVGSIKSCIAGFGVQNEAFTYAYIIINSILAAGMWIAAISGFMQMYKIHCADDEKSKPHLGFAMFYLPFELLISCVLTMTNDGRRLNIESTILAAILTAVYIFIIVQFVKLKNRLWDADAKYGIDSWNQKNTAVMCTAVALSIICPMFFMYSYAVKDTPETQLMVHDTQNKSDADTVRENLLGLGMDADVLEMIPDSEVMNYKDCISISKTEEIYNNGIIPESNIYNFYFRDDENSRMRTLFVMNVENCDYRCGFYYWNYEGYNNLEPINDSVYVSIIQKQGSEYYEKEPINSSFPNLCDPFLTQGFDFRAEENQTVLFALSFSLRNYSEDFLLNNTLVIVNQTMPFTLAYNTVEDFAAATINNSNTFNRIEDPAMKSSMCRDGSFFEPEMVGLEEESE